MAIYKSSFNQKPEKPKKERSEAKPKPQKAEKVKKQHKQFKKIKINVAAVCLVVFCLLFLICMFKNPIRHVILGLVGLSIYPVCVLGAFFSVTSLLKRQFRVKTRYLVYLICSVSIVWFIFHLIMANVLHLPLTSYGAYLGQTYKAQTTAGGLIFSLISYPLVKVITYVGAYILCAIALAIFVGLIIDYVFADRSGMVQRKTKFDFKEIEDFDTPTIDKQPEPFIPEPEQIKHEAKRKLGLEKGESKVISTSLPKVEPAPKPTASRPMSKRDYILTPIDPIIPPEDTNDLFLDSNTGYYNSKKINKKRVEEIKPKEDVTNVQANLFETEVEKEEEVNKQAEQIVPHYNEEVSSISTEEQEDKYKDIILEDDNLEDFDNFVELNSTKTEEEPSAEQQIEQKETFDINKILKEETDFKDENSEVDNYLEPEVNESLAQTNKNKEEVDYKKFDVMAALDDTNQKTTKFEEIQTDLVNEYVDELEPARKTPTNETFNLGSTVSSEVVRPSIDISKFNLPNRVNKSLEPEQMKIEDIKPKEEIPPYVAPNAEMLEYLEHVESISEEKLQDNVERLEQVLADFKVPAKVNNVTVGPAVTRYELSMPRGISVNKIVTMADDIAMTLASNGSIRVEAPIPGKNSVGVEVPNDKVTPVSLRELIDSQEFRVRGNPLSFILGKDINGDIIFCNLDKMPHLLVAGSTGSGKSVCLNTMLLSMCYKAGPQDLRFILIDPKMVEFSTYNGLPHLLMPEVITGKEMTINAFDWAIKEMEARYALFAKNHVVNINEYNKLDIVKSKKVEKLPFIVIVVDELADLMLEAKRELEDRIAKIAAKSRAAGIHLVLATQRPSVDVITGVIKNNLPSRVAFALTSYVDSKTILDGGGAEKLLGKGDMLFKMQDKPDPRRVQGAFVSSAEINRVVEFIKNRNKPVYDDAVSRAIRNPHKQSAGADSVPLNREQEFDPILKDVLRMFIEAKQASTSMIQRRYSVGYNRAGRIVEQMEEAGFITPPNGSKPRQVLITMEEFKAIFGDD